MVCQGYKTCKIGVFLAAFISIVVLSENVSAEEDKAKPSIQPESSDEILKPKEFGAIQNRTHRLNAEFFLLAGTFPSDALYKAYFATFGYGHHTSDTWGWQFQVSYAMGYDSNLKKELLNPRVSLRSQNAVFEEIKARGTLQLLYKPLYGKETLLHDTVLRLAFYGQAGPAFVMTYSATPKGQQSQNKFYPGLDLSLGFRVWLSRSWSWRSDFGEVMYLAAGGKMKQALFVQTGFAVSLAGDEPE